ncbi:MAG: hypothetical protein DRQ43_10250, partial [Gammaproteobacteria bacterium]
LEHVIEGAMNIVGADEVIQIKHLQTHFSNWPVKAKPARIKRRQDDMVLKNRSTNLFEKKSEHEEDIVRKAFFENKGNITRTAKSLGISRQLLYYKIKKFNISRETATR